MKSDVDEIVTSINWIVLHCVCTIVVIGNVGSDWGRTGDFNLEGISSISSGLAFRINSMNCEYCWLVANTALLHKQENGFEDLKIFAS